ncbi:mitochondrial ribosomal protein L18 [Rhodnius prolixus]|uniref:Large ribosomal subunit protein uL18m n=1 Tax=Rhodnius prolixus TaxID=13249 RepID=T1HA52_RHOPR
MTAKNFQNSLQKVVNSTSFPKYVYNRNPRNLEKLCIAYKPDGWHLEKPGRSYWHRLFVERSSRALTAYVKHYTGHIPVQASTKEWAIRKHLYSAVDKGAYFNLSRVLASRCLQFGITEMYSEFQPTEEIDGCDTNLQIFINELKNCGVTLKEPERYINPRPSDLERPDKAWDYF